MIVAARLVAKSHARIVYLVDVGMSTTTAAVVARLLRKSVIVDTGDAAFAIARSVGGRSLVGLALVGAGEEITYRCAQHVVVRGREHLPMVPRSATHIPDLPPADAKPVPATALRQALAIDNSFVVGIVGSIVRAPRLGITYGWDIIEALALTTAEVSALIVGDGTGLEQLEARAEELGVASRCRFIGAVHSTKVFEYVSAMDVGISTQSNDVVGRVRTTGKLPLYLACGCPVLASHVGAAAELLGPLGWTLPYDGVVDVSYPARLAAAIDAWSADTCGQEQRRVAALNLAREAFDADVMRERLAKVLDGIEQ
jgi:glycosyltransferase involved in cell wall biosynthesis